MRRRKEEAVGEEAVDEAAGGEEAGGEEAVDEEAVDKEAVDGEAVDKEAVDEEAAGRSALSAPLPSASPSTAVPPYRRTALSSGMRRLARLFLILFVLPTLIGGLVMLLAGRPLIFEVLQRGISYKFPDVNWIVTRDLARWREDPARPQPVLLDARSEAEYEVSHLQGARRIDPYQPSLVGLTRFPKDTPIVVYSAAGYRGARVASWLGKAGYPKVQNLGSSLFQWTNEGRPIFQGTRRAEVVHPYDGWWGWGWLLEGKYRAQVPAVERHSAAP